MIATEPNLFKIRVKDTYGSPYAYAIGYTPLADRKSFVPDSMIEREEEFTRINGSKPGIRIDKEKRLWPDFLYNGGGWVSFFVSERVVEDIRSAGIEFLDATEFPIECIEGKSRLKLEEAPRYFVLEAIPEIFPDWNKMGVPTSDDGRPLLPLPRPSPPTLYRDDTWTGRDLVSDARLTHWLFCNQTFIALAVSRGWTNVEFEPVGSFRINTDTEQVMPPNGP
jgi:hypothetical protein